MGFHFNLSSFAGIEGTWISWYWGPTQLSSLPFWKLLGPLLKIGWLARCTFNGGSHEARCLFDLCLSCALSLGCRGCKAGAKTSSQSCLQIWNSWAGLWFAWTNCWQVLALSLDWLPMATFQLRKVCPRKFWVCQLHFHRESWASTSLCSTCFARSTCSHPFCWVGET